MNIFQILILSSILLVICFIIFSVWFSYRHSREIYKPKHKRKNLEIFPDQLKLPFHQAIFKTKDNVKLNGWFLPSEGSEKTIILMHGWSMNKGDIFDKTTFLHSLGYNLFYFDFRGTGESGGISSVGYKETKDLQAAIDYLHHTQPDACKEIGIYGISMGAAIGIYHTAKKGGIKCIVTESPYYSYEVVVARWAWIHKKIPYFPFVWLALKFAKKHFKINPEYYSPSKNIADVKVPIFFIYGRNDALVPIINARKLLNKVNKPKDLWVIPGAEHAKCAETGGKEYQKRISQFFKKHL